MKYPGYLNRDMYTVNTTVSDEKMQNKMGRYWSRFRMATLYPDWIVMKIYGFLRNTNRNEVLLIFNDDLFSEAYSEQTKPNLELIVSFNSFRINSEKRIPSCIKLVTINWFDACLVTACVSIESHIF